MKIKKNNRINKIVIITFAIICLFINFNFVSASGDTAYDIGEYIIDATVMKNGNLHVVEKIRFDFDESANGIYRDIMYKYNYAWQKDDMNPSSSRYQANFITNTSVSKTNSNYTGEIGYVLYDENLAVNGMDYIYTENDEIEDGYLKRIKIYVPSYAGDETYMKIEYDIEDVAVLYNDYGEFYWNFVGAGWDCSISNLKVNIDFEGYSNKQIKIYPHSYANLEEVTNKNGKLSFKSDYVSAGTAVDARVVFSNEYLDKAQVEKIYNENYDFNELEKIENKMKTGKIRYQISSVIVFIIIILTVIYFVLLVRKSNKISSKGKVKKPDYYTEPLSNLNLSVYTKLNGAYLTNSNLLMATILDLKQKKILKMDSLKKLKKSFDGIEYDYYLTLNENADFSDLYDYERLVLNYLFNGEASTELNNFKEGKIELNERFKELSKNYKEARKFNVLCAKLDERINEVVLEKTDKSLKGFTFKSLTGLATIAAVNTLLISPLNFSLKMETLEVYGVIGIFILIFSLSLSLVRSLKEDYYEEYNKFKGLERYLKEYSLIKDRYPIEIALWDRYLVFATLLGIAKKVAKEFKEELIKNGYDDDYIYTNYPVISMSMYCSELSSHAATSTGSSSSGGYSGGGSGGGGGRRWRRRFFLVELKM